MTHMYFSARTEGRISYGHLGRTDSCVKLSIPHVDGPNTCYFLTVLKMLSHKWRYILVLVYKTDVMGTYNVFIQGAKNRCDSSHTCVGHFRYLYLLGRSAVGGAQGWYGRDILR